MTSTSLIAGLLVWVLLATGVLRTMAIARRADDLTARQWERLAHMHSQSGIAFFPTNHARLELEVAIAYVVRGRQRDARRRRGRTAATLWPASPSRSS
jgi:biopolymer transport protein ExbB/TolQ